MVKVLIDGIACDFDDSLPIALSFSSEDMVDIESGRSGKSVSFKLAATATNSSIFGAEGDIHSQERFNKEWHEMLIEADGITIFSGTAYLMEVVWAEGERYFSVECRGGVISWAEVAFDTLFKEIPIEFSSTLNLSNIMASWESDDAVKFFPIVRDSYEAEGSVTDVTGVRLLRSIDDYHPFIRVSSLIEAIFALSGYQVISQSSTDEYFEELYVSGSYSSAENSAARSAMGFYAKRGEDVTTTTDYLGRVSMSPYDIASTVGNIIDIGTTTSDSECYNYGNVLQMDSQAVTFVPLTQISAGFEYYLHYTCECQIESRTKLKGIDSLNTVDNGIINWEITNRYEDQRDNPQTSISYSLVIFDFAEGETYRLLGVNSLGYTTEIASITSRLTKAIFTTEYTSLVLQKQYAMGYAAYTGDWALYFGYIEEFSSTEVKITVRSSPTTYTPTSPMCFEFQTLEGAVGGVEFTLHSDSSVQPYFSSYPGYNSSITFSDIAQQSFSALDFLTALQHLFSLRFLTNEEAKSVTIECFDEFYTSKINDWSGKLIAAQEVTFVDLAHSTHRSVTYGYQQTDGVVQRMGESDNAYFGEWTFSVDSYAAASTALTQLNPIFSASTNDEDGVLAVGDRDDESTVDSLSFSPRIARYFRLQEIEGENYSLPYVSFHSPDDDFTLCFEDRDGVSGLNRLHRSYVELLGRGQVVTLSLNLTALDYSNLLAADGAGPSLRDIFYFEICGESFRTILYSIESYNPQSGVARCSFLTID